MLQCYNVKYQCTEYMQLQTVHTVRDSTLQTHLFKDAYVTNPDSAMTTHQLTTLPQVQQKRLATLPADMVSIILSLPPTPFAAAASSTLGLVKIMTIMASFTQTSTMAATANGRTVVGPSLSISQWSRKRYSHNRHKSATDYKRRNTWPRANQTFAMQI